MAQDNIVEDPRQEIEKYLQEEAHMEQLISRLAAMVTRPLRPGEWEQESQMRRLAESIFYPRNLTEEQTQAVLAAFRLQAPDFVTRLRQVLRRGPGLYL